MSQPTIVVTGATGNVGRRLVPLLLDAGASVRAVTRDPDSADLPPGVSAVRADLLEPSGLDAAFADADAVFLVWPDTSADGAGPVVDAIAGHARRVVFLSALGVPDADPAGEAPTGLFHARVEWLIRRTGLEWTFLRAGGFATNTLGWADEIRSSDTVTWVYGAAGRSLIHEADIAAVAVRALTEEGHTGARYELTGPSVVTQTEQVRLIGEAVGREVRWVDLSEKDARERMREMGWAPEFIDSGLAHWASIVTDPEPVTDTVEKVTGAPARPFARWAIEHADAFR
ncbi:MAG: NAD(P)H-binding protein [Actinophytocola sp.]|uniref:SDR family oxidoreductase n=1 Tax=Actinophytocola sp. TaxID=1872138 RepID=UPI001326D819|nr:NAD(P)H-binding protein [Actinophytocola sp.]MPZ83845.1 NAD(P)H-binding protein [Actinophytocola sp.]